MHAHSLLLLASFALPICSAPVPVNKMDTKDASIIDHRSDSSVTGLLHGLVMRSALIEAVPAAHLYKEDEVRRDVSDQQQDEENRDPEDHQEEEEDDDEASDVTQIDAEEKRGWRTRPGGKRGSRVPPGGP